VSTPIIAAVYALAGTPAPRSYPASYPYAHPTRFHDITTGATGTCPQASAYLCHAEPGYDGPTGLGTPDGIGGFSRYGANPVTLVDPGPHTATAGQPFRLVITGLNVRSATAGLRFTATGQPAGLSPRRLAGTTSGVLSGTVKASNSRGTYHVIVTGTDPATGHSATTRFTIRVT
jgi:hypothetical protein